MALHEHHFGRESGASTAPADVRQAMPPRLAEPQEPDTGSPTSAPSVRAGSGARPMRSNGDCWLTPVARAPRAVSRGVVSRLHRLAIALLCGLALAGSPVQAGPRDGKVISGVVDFEQPDASRLNVIQGTDRAIVDWRSFSIGAGEHVDFQQPSSTSMTLNRVTGSARSDIFGRLTANGTVLLINPSGILFGQGATVDVSGLVATTIDLRNDDFLKGRFDFDINRLPANVVVNRGEITAAEGGLVALVAPGVENSGVIRARLGRVALASGNRFTLDLHGDRLVQLAVDDRVAARLAGPEGAALTSLVGNSGVISAAGGTVLLSAVGARDVVDQVINMDGIIEARSVAERDGEIILLGVGEGIVRAGGGLDASGRDAGEVGGRVSILGERVGLIGNAAVDASGHIGGGEVLVGGNYQGRGPERNAEYTTVGRDVVIRADAARRGDGGRAIVWSDGVTRFFGTISARGGRLAGDGGLAEVSGKRNLQFAPRRIDLGAPAGATGKLLLDPRDIVISDSSGTNNTAVSGDNKVLFGDDSGTDYAIQPSAFEAINADITLQATRDITVSSPIDRSGAADSTLALQAGRHLNINAAITGTNGAHSFIFEADSPQSGATNNDGTGTLTIGNVSITSNNGNITLIAAGFAIDTTTDADIDAGTGNINVAPSRSAAMTINSTAANLSDAEIDSFKSSGTITIGRATTGPDDSGGSGTAVSASSLTLDQALSIAASGAVTFDSGGTTTLKSNVSSNDGNVTFSDAVTLDADVTVDADADNDGTDGDITFSSTINAKTAGTESLTLDADTGDVTLSGAVGGANELDDLSITGADLSLSAVTLAGTLTLTSTGTITLNGDITVDDSSLTFGRPVTVGADTTIDTDGDDDANDGNITFSSTVNGANSLTLDADSGTVTFSGAVGGTTKLESLTVSAASQADLDLISTTGAISVTATDIDLNAANYKSDDGNISFTGAVDLESSVTVNSDADTDATDGNITFSSTIDAATAGTETLTLTAGAGTVTLSGTVGGTTKPGSLTISAASQADLALISTTGAISVTATNIDLNAANYKSDDGNISFTGAVDLATSVTVNSDADTDANDGTITFSSTIDATTTGSGNTPESLTLAADTGNVTLTGAAGGTNKLNNLTITGANLSLSAVTLAGTLTLTPGSTSTITLNGNITTDDSSLTFSRPVTVGADLTVNTDGDNDANDGNITFSSTVNGGNSLTLDADTGTVTLSGTVGGSTKLESLTVSAASQADLAQVSTTGAISVTATNIDLNAANYKSDDGNITFTGAVDLATSVTVDSDADTDANDGNITFSSTVDGGNSLTLDAGTGTVTFSGTVGGTTKLGSLTVSAASQADLAQVSTTGAISVTATNIDLNAANYKSDDGNISFTGAVDLATSVTVDSDADTDANDGDITFSSTIDATTTGSGNTPESLTLDAGAGNVTTLSGAAGGTNKLNNLSITGDDLSLSAVTLAGTLTLAATGTITLNGDITTDDSDVSFSRPVMVGSDTTIDTDGDNDSTDGDISFSSTIDAKTAGSQSLTLDADSSTVTVTGAAGGTKKLNTLTVSNASRIDLGSVTSAGAISITGTIIYLNGSSYRSDDGNITFTGIVRLGTNVTIDSDADNDANDGDIELTSTVEATTVGGQSMTLDASTGDVTITGAAGGTNKLNNLSVIGQ